MMVMCNFFLPLIQMLGVWYIVFVCYTYQFVTEDEVFKILGAQVGNRECDRAI